MQGHLTGTSTLLPPLVPGRCSACSAAAGSRSSSSAHREPRRPLPPRVSVVVPAYNNAEFIEATLDSLLGQTFSNYELLVIADGSIRRSAAERRGVVVLPEDDPSEPG